MEEHSRTLPNGSVLFGKDAPKDVVTATEYRAATESEYRGLSMQMIDNGGRLSREDRKRFNELKRERAKGDRLVQRFYVRLDRKEAKAKERARKAETRARERELVRLNKRAKTLAKQSYRKAAFVRLPARAKPSLATTKDGRHTDGAWLVKTGRGDAVAWCLLVTDSYQLVKLPLEVSNPTAIKPGYVPAEALKAIEKAGTFRITRSGAILPLEVSQSVDSVRSEKLKQEAKLTETWRVPAVNVYRSEAAGTAYVPNDKPTAPKVAEALPKAPAKTARFEVRLNPEVLLRAAKAAGHNGKGPLATLVLDTRSASKGDAGRYVEGTVRLELGDDTPVEGAIATYRHGS